MRAARARGRCGNTRPLVSFAGRRSERENAIHALRQVAGGVDVRRLLARRLMVDNEAIRRDLARGTADDFAQTDVYRRLFSLADRTSGKRVARAVVPDIALTSPKITRKLTTEWFARRVDTRFQACLARRDA